MNAEQFISIIEKFRVEECKGKKHIYPLQSQICNVCRITSTDIISLTLKCPVCSTHLAILKEGVYCYKCVIFI